MSKVITGEVIVELKYELREGGASGELLEMMDEHWPLKFYFGGGSMLPAFEAQLAGLSEGDAFSFTLNPDDAYGQVKPELFREIPLSTFEDDPMFQPDQMESGEILLLRDAGGREISGTVIEILPESYLIDFNHALAGKDLHFSGNILYIRTPRAEERNHKRYIEPNGVRSNSRLSDGPDFI
jgi:FKBP-type peptidyl-prolyl cis-trans isomerase SlyD